MASGDVGLLDVATAVDAGASTDAGAGVESGAVETPEISGGEVDAGGEAGAEAGGGERGAEAGAEGGEQSAEGAKGQPKADTLDGQKFAANTPQSIRKQLKEWNDQLDKSTPEGKAAAGVIKQLHGAYERWSAATQIFPKGVQEMKAAAALIKDNGGSIEAAQARFAAVQAVDEKLYAMAEDPKSADLIVADIIDDLNNEKKDVEKSLGNFANSLVNALRRMGDGGAWSDKVAVPVLAEAFRSANVNQAMNGIVEAFNAGDNKKLGERLTRLIDWVRHINKTDDEQRNPKVTPEMEKFEVEKKQWTTARRRESEDGVLKATNSSDNATLGSHLKPFLNTAFFKGFPRETLMIIAGNIQNNLKAELKADTAYQTQMRAYWSAKTLDKAKITAYHSDKVSQVAARVVRETIQKMYPQYAKSTAAQGRIAAQQTRNAANAQSVAQGKPIYVVSRPKDLVHEDITVGGKTYTKEQLQTLQITGRGFVRNSNGTFRFVTWRR